MLLEGVRVYSTCLVDCSGHRRLLCVQGDRNLRLVTAEGWDVATYWTVHDIWLKMSQVAPLVALIVLCWSWLFLLDVRWTNCHSSIVDMLGCKGGRGSRLCGKQSKTISRLTDWLGCTVASGSSSISSSCSGRAQARSAPQWCNPRDSANNVAISVTGKKIICPVRVFFPLFCFSISHRQCKTAFDQFINGTGME